MSREYRFELSMAAGTVIAQASIMVQLRRLSSANSVSMFFKAFRQVMSHMVHQNGPGERLAPYAVPGARA